MAMPWKIECTVWGGVTGHRTGMLKHEGKEVEFATYEEAKAEADQLMRDIGSNPHATAYFRYVPVSGNW